MAAVLGGYAIAAITITQGNTELGSGAFHGANPIAFWSETSVGLTTQTGTPAVLSTTVGTPTVLAGAATTYAINAPTVGDVVHYWKFTEAAAAPVNTELEIQFTVSTGLVPAVTTVTVYVETQAASPGAAIVFTMNYDLGNAGTATITLNSVMQISQQCSAVGTCP